ncbi:hypothetical protein ACFO5K_23970 [Nocardia halotolerans]|uniref:Uncharacterized protein n=1 Tax=Nocardia halotolerans TaxID=1755878 RepID=A0ABV8VMX2_9NOCA
MPIRAAAPALAGGGGTSADATVREFSTRQPDRQADDPRSESFWGTLVVEIQHFACRHLA